MKNFILSIFNEYKRKRGNQKMISTVRRLVKENWGSSDTVYDSKFTKERLITKRFNVGKLSFKIYRAFRGDLVEVFLNEKTVITFVDQSFQYDGLMGLNDIVINISKEEFENAIQTINS